ncbi:hypothetical protein [Salmonella enterica]|uniref:hypothetical protein n=1 Tax=Salmonella enterica TaxID=28901 RepID=UPI0026DB0098|nr:hypothetical protein [Salmonella enterica]MDO3920379.1 hypothetical protein [Salmonella enterica]
MAVLRSLVTTLGLNAAQFRQELKLATNDFGSFKDDFVKGAKVIGVAGAAIGGVAIAGVTALAADIRETYTEVNELAKAGRNLGMSASQWDSWSQAASMAGSSGEQLADVIKDLQVRITDAAKTGGGPLVDFFKQIGQSAEDWARMSPEKQLESYVNELNKMSESDALFWLDELNDSAAELKDTLLSGQFFAFAKQIESLGLSLSNVQFEQIREAQNDIAKLENVMSGMWRQVEAAAAPVVSMITEGITDWVVEAAEAQGGFKQLGITIVEYVLSAIEAVAKTTEELFNGIYTQGVKLHVIDDADNGELVRRLDVQKGQLTAHYKELNEIRQRTLKNEIIDGLPTGKEFFSGTEKDAERMRVLNGQIEETTKQVNQLETQINKPFTFADDLTKQLDTARAALKKVADEKPTDATPVVRKGVAVIDDGKAAAAVSQAGQQFKAFTSQIVQSNATALEKIDQQEAAALAKMLDAAAKAKASATDVAAARIGIAEQYAQERQKIAEQYAPGDKAEREAQEIFATIDALRQRDLISQADYLAAKSQGIADHAATVAQMQVNRAVTPSDRLAGQVDPIQETRNQLAEQQALYNAYYEQGIIDKARYEQLMVAASRTAVQAEQQAMIDAYASMSDFNATAVDLIGQVGDRFANMITGLATGQQTFEEAMTNMAATIMNTMFKALVDLYVQALMTWAVTSMLGVTGGAGGSSGGSGTLIQSTADSFAGFFDSGGDIPSGSWGIAGENGAEIVKGPASVTSTKDTAALLSGGSGSSGSGAMVTNVYQTINVSGAGDDALATATAQGAKQGAESALASVKQDFSTNGQLRRSLGV